MKKTKILGAILAGVLMFTGVPAVSNPFTPVAYAAAAKLAAPTGFKAASKTETTIKLTWNKVSGADAYRVYMYNSTTDEYKTYKNVSSNVCNVKSLKKGTKYKFRVAALVKSGSKYVAQTKSSSISVTTSEKLLPAPTGLTYSATENSITLSWKTVTGASAYRVLMYNSNSGKYETYKNVSGTSCNVNGLKFNTTYKFKIAALISSGNKLKEQTQTGIISVTTKDEKKVSCVTENNIKVTVGSSYYFRTAETSFAEYKGDKGKLGVCYNVVLENLGTSVNEFSHLEYDVYDCNGNKTDDITWQHYLSPKKGALYVKIRPGAKVDQVLYFPYEGDGDYILSIKTGFMEWKDIILHINK